MGLEDRVAVVTGGASGLGLGVARRVAEAGGSVFLLDIDGDRGSEEASRLGPAATYLPCDVRDSASVTSAVDEAAERARRIDLLVNAAGVAPAQRVVARDGSMFDLDLFRFVVEVNLVGTFDVVRNVAKVMTGNSPGPDGERGVIVNVASIAAFEGQVGQAAYAASKGGVVGMTLALARDLADHGIRVVTVAPGIMDTPMLAGAPPELREALAKLHVFPRRLGTPDDFAGLVEAIVETPLLNGEVIRLDAGARMPPR